MRESLKLLCMKTGTSFTRVLVSQLKSSNLAWCTFHDSETIRDHFGQKKLQRYAVFPIHTAKN